MDLPIDPKLAESGAVVLVVFLFLVLFKLLLTGLLEQAKEDRAAFKDGLTRVIDSHEAALNHIVEKLDNVQDAVLDMTHTIKRLEEEILSKR